MRTVVLGGGSGGEGVEKCALGFGLCALEHSGIARKAFHFESWLRCQLTCGETTNLAVRGHSRRNREVSSADPRLGNVGLRDARPARFPVLLRGHLRYSLAAAGPCRESLQ